MIPYDLRFQHDEYGNAPHLLNADDKALIESGAIRRVGGDAECPSCGKTWYKHEQVLGALWLTRGCDTEFLLKL